ncbi:hypothetical protein GCM10023093_27280 [Nemorincola caseinilytica]|uniref:Uncharacterized protein n=1 Tax=Nemorincola caseinilytica TaxID=2054315 RepID=A0ABP8NLD2_9BACT
MLLSLSYQCFVKLGIVIWYQVNKDYIAKNLCENRAKPEKKCCGKCYLNKQLKKADQDNNKEGTSIPAKWKIGEVMAYTLPAAIHIPFVAVAHTGHQPPGNIVFHPLFHPGSVFHPPAVC